MVKSTIVSSTVFKVIAVMLLTAVNGWAIPAYTQKFGVGCKSCHTSGPMLNDHGVTFKRNGHTIGGKKAPQEEKSRQRVPKDDNGSASKSSDKNQDKPVPVNGEVTTNQPVANSPAPDIEQPIPETMIYSWKTEDGTPYFSDTPHMDILDENMPASDKARKKIARTRFRPLPVIIPKRTLKTAAKALAPRPEKPVLPGYDSPDVPETGHIVIKPEEMPISYEKCMEQILSGYPTPKDSETAMKEFQDAESRCAPFEKK